MTVIAAMPVRPEPPWRTHFRQRIAVSLWFVPAIFAVAAIGVANLTIWLDAQPTSPGGAFYAFPSWKPLLGHSTPHGERLDIDEQFCRYLLHDFGIAVIPGAPFGAPGHFQISYATSQPVLQEAMTRLRTACTTLTRKSSGRPV